MTTDVRDLSYPTSNTCLRCGSSVGSKNPQVLETTTITRAIITTAGIFTNAHMELFFGSTAHSVKKGLI